MAFMTTVTLARSQTASVVVVNHCSQPLLSTIVAVVVFDVVVSAAVVFVLVVVQ